MTTVILNLTVTIGSTILTIPQFVYFVNFEAGSVFHVAELN